MQASRRIPESSTVGGAAAAVFGFDLQPAFAELDP